MQTTVYINRKISFGNRARNLKLCLYIYHNYIQAAGPCWGALIQCCWSRSVATPQQELQPSTEGFVCGHVSGQTWACHRGVSRLWQWQCWAGRVSWWFTHRTMSFHPHSLKQQRMVGLSGAVDHSHRCFHVRKQWCCLSGVVQQETACLWSKNLACYLFCLVDFQLLPAHNVVVQKNRDTVSDTRIL